MPSREGEAFERRRKKLAAPLKDYRPVRLAVLLGSLLVVPALALVRIKTFLPPGVLLPYLVSVNGLGLLLNWVDKTRAQARPGKRGRRPARVPESVLHTVELLGGWPTALATQQLIRHKTRKISYQVVLWAIITLYLIASIGFLLPKSL
ncbi:MAG: DUF1294 domain-containing protein [Verrucomicrobiota bacterium]